MEKLHNNKILVQISLVASLCNNYFDHFVEIVQRSMCKLSIFLDKYDWLGIIMQ